MKIIKKHINELLPAPYNPRVDVQKDNSFYQKLYSSLINFGYVEPIIWNKQTGFVVGGNQRLSVLKDIYKEENITEVDVVEVDLPLEKEKALNLALNKISGDWDYTVLAEVLSDLNKENGLIELSGFSDDEIEQIINDNTEHESVEEDFDSEEALQREAKYEVKQGDVFELGSHRLMCGDSTNKKDVEVLMDNNKIDLVVTSPPYNVNINYEEYDDKKTNREYIDFINKVMKNNYDFMNDGRMICWNIGVSANTDIFSHFNCLSSLFDYYRLIVWKKSGVAYPVFKTTKQIRGYNPNYQHELILICSKGKPEKGEKLKNKPVEYENDVWEIHQSKATRDLKTVNYGKYGLNRHAVKSHPAAYPKEIPQGCIYYLTNENENVYDCFGGSGSTLIACEQTNRSCYMMEIDPHYCSVIIERWETLTGQKHKKVKNDGS